jgi:hypothetical protein
MRSLNSTNFEQGECGLHSILGDGSLYWRGNYSNNSGNYISIWEISEDVLKDGRKQYENGLGQIQIVNLRPIWEMFQLHNLSLCVLIPM